MHGSMWNKKNLTFNPKLDRKPRHTLMFTCTFIQYLHVLIPPYEEHGLHTVATSMQFCPACVVYTTSPAVYILRAPRRQGNPTQVAFQVCKASWCVVVCGVCTPVKRHQGAPCRLLVPPPRLLCNGETRFAS